MKKNCKQKIEKDSSSLNEKDSERKAETSVVSWARCGSFSILGERITANKFFSKIRVIPCTDNKCC
jgi:hypothetical protein